MYQVLSTKYQVLSTKYQEAMGSRYVASPEAVFGSKWSGFWRSRTTEEEIIAGYHLLRIFF